MGRRFLSVTSVSYHYPYKGEAAQGNCLRSDSDQRSMNEPNWCEPLRNWRRRNLGSLQINMVLYFQQTKGRKRRKKSLLGLLNLGKVLTTASVNGGGFSGYFSSPAGMISLCIFRLWDFFLMSRGPPNHLHLHNVFRKSKFAFGVKKDIQTKSYAQV